MTSAAQNAILRHYQFSALGVVSVQVTPRTRPLLKLAGVSRAAKAHSFVDVPVKRDAHGHLTVAAPVPA